jgi:fatty acid desaturase
MEHAVRQGQWLPTLGYLPLLLLGWALTVSGARKGQVGVQHMCAHENFFATPWLDAWIGTLVSILLTLGSFEGYERTHGPVHHGQTMMPPDATRRFQEDIIGLRPGMPREECWRKFYHALWSPRVHGQLLAKRLRGHFHFSEATPGHAVATAACMLGVLGLVASSGAWVLFLVVWIVPLTVLY